MSTKKRSRRSKKCSAVTSLPSFYEDPLSTLKTLQQKNTTKKLQDVLRGYRDHDPSYFTYDESLPNLLRLLDVYECDGKHLIASCSLKDISPSCRINLFSVLVDWYIHKKCDDVKEEKTKLDYLIESTNDKEQKECFLYEKNVYLAELANFYFQLGPRYYSKARHKFTEVMKWLRTMWGDDMTALDKFTLETCSVSYAELLDIYKRLPEDDPMRKKMIFWTFQCATLYSKLLQKGNLHILRACLPTSGITETKMVNIVFKNIRDMLHFVASTEDEQFSGWAWAILADTMKIYEFIGPRSDRTCELPYKMSTDECMKRAAEISPNHPHALYSVGRHFRQKATSLEDFRVAANYLEEAVKSCPTLHKAYHHLGLAYRSMWILERGFPEVQLYTNQRKKGQPGRSTGRRHKPRYKPKNTAKQVNQRTTYSDLAAVGGQVEVTEELLAEVPPHCQRNCSTPGADHADSVAGCSARSESLNEQFNKMTKVQSVYSKKPSISLGGSLPDHYKRPDFFDNLRTSNPIQKSELQNDYLIKSHQNLLEASKMVHHSSPRYLIDLARICINMQKEKSEIEKLFSDARDLLVDGEVSDAIDGAYLFEQWGLYDANFSDDEKTKKHLQESVSFSVRAKQRSRVAFYRLLDLLDEMAKRAGDDERLAIVKEKIFVRQLVEQYGRARDEIRAALGHPPDDLLNTVLERPENKELLFPLIKCYHGEKNFDSAKYYLMLYITCSHDEVPPPEEAELALDIAISALPEEDTEQKDFTFRRIFRWVFSEELETDTDEPGTVNDGVEVTDDDDDGDDDDDDFEEVDIAIFSEALDDDWLVPKLKKTFEYLNLQTFCDDDDDIAELALGGTKYEAWEKLCDNIDKVHLSLVDMKFSECTFHRDVKENCCKKCKSCLNFTRESCSDGTTISLSEKDISSKELIRIVIMKALDALKVLQLNDDT